jgi:hypothetical protein
LIDHDSDRNFTSPAELASPILGSACGNSLHVILQPLGMALYEIGSTSPLELEACLDRVVAEAHVVAKSRGAEDDEVPELP